MSAYDMKLLVEGFDEKRVIPELVDKYIRWGDIKSEWPVEIVSYDGIENLLAEGEVETQLKTPRLKSLGIMIDSNDDALGRYGRVAKKCVAMSEYLPNAPEDEGVVVENEEGLRLGIWLMPDNRSQGMLETFLAYLITESSSDLWAYATETVDCSKERGATYRDAHYDKARIHTWLALNDPPGQSFQVAIMKGMLDPGRKEAFAFIRWFCRLFDVEPRDHVKDQIGLT